MAQESSDSKLNEYTTPEFSKSYQSWRHRHLECLWAPRLTVYRLVTAAPGNTELFQARRDRQSRSRIVALRLPQPAADRIAQHTAGHHIRHPMLAICGAAHRADGRQAIQPRR